MNSERWTEIVSSFGPGVISVGEVANASASHVKSLDEGLPPKNLVSRNAWEEEARAKDDVHVFQSGFLEENNDKVVENLCKALKERNERIKCQERVISELNERLNCRHVCHASVQTIANPGCREDDWLLSQTSTDSGPIKLILNKIDTLEKRLNAFIDVVQARKSTVARVNSGLRPIRSDFSLEYARPTQSSLMREMLCRSRVNDDPSMMTNFRDSYSSKQTKGLPVTCVEARVETLEKLVVVLKEKIMRKVNAKRKRVRR